MSRIDELFAEIDNFTDTLRAEIEALLFARWADWTDLRAALTCLENGDGVCYRADCAEIYAVVSFDASKIPEREREFFRDYIHLQGAFVDFDADTLESYQGDDNYIIQDEFGCDNGVYQFGKRIFGEHEYRAKFLNQGREDDEPELDEADDNKRRNALIEAHMERSGFYPGVFRLTFYGDVFAVKTNG